jgi:hypothetical protein
MNQKNSLAEILMRGSRLMANANTRGKRFEEGLSDKKDSAMTNDLTKNLQERRDLTKTIYKSDAGRSDPAGTTTKFSFLPKGIFLPNSRLPSP